MKIKFSYSYYILLIFLSGVCSCNSKPESSTDLKLWYDQPARVWEEALPIGNGRLGAMVYGDPINELYQLNEETLWSGGPGDKNNPLAVKALPLVREAINKGDYILAAKLWKENAQGPYTGRYLPLADLKLGMNLNNNIDSCYRDLNIGNATASVRFNVGDTIFTRTSFISYPDQVMVIKIESNKKNSISLNLQLKSQLKYKIDKLGNNGLKLIGLAPSYVSHRTDEILYDSINGMRFEVQMKALLDKGNSFQKDSILSIEKADKVTLIVSAATSFNGYDKNPGTEGKDPSIAATNFIEKAINKSYDNLLKDHTQDYKALFDRVSFKLNGTKNNSIPTNKQLQQFADNNSDFGLIELYYQFGRYLAISSSRIGGIPSNLQGIWNKHIQPPWGSNYTTNINTEMNYWLTETTALPECFLPLSDFVKNLAANGEKTAKINYGIQNGWVAHHNSDIWAQTAPAGGYDKDPRSNARWSCWPMAGIWFCQNIWEHYAFGGDKNYLQNTAYPLMKGAAEFALSWLQNDEETGYLVTNPSTSPENSFLYNYNGKELEGEMSRATTMDMALIKDLFTNCIRASTILNTDEDFRETLKMTLNKLYPFQIGSEGQVQEWDKDFKDKDPKHRHISHLVSLHPGSQILSRRDTLLAAASKKTLEMRGFGGTGWAMAWKINFWARLENGENAYAMLKNGLKFVDVTSVSMGGGGTYSNLFDAHPPFQIDGNFGATAGITEMLLQSHGGDIFLLPAIPNDWNSGSVKGLRARGGFIVDINWNEGKIKEVKITSTLGGNCRLRSFDTLKSKFNLTKVVNENSNPFYYTPKSYKFVNNSSKNLELVKTKETFLVDFPTEKGKIYTLTSKN